MQKEISHPIPIKRTYPGKEGTENGCMAGIVENVSGVYYERPDFDWYRFGAQLILFLIFLPFLLALCIALLAVSIAFGIFRLSPLSMFISVFNLLLTFKLFGIIFPFHFGSDKPLEVPVRVMRLATEKGKEYDIVIKGSIRGTYPQEGDQIDVMGKWDDELLRFERGFNHNIGSAFRLRRFPWRAIFFVLLFLIVGAGVWISVSVPLTGY